MLLRRPSALIGTEATGSPEFLSRFRNTLEGLITNVPTERQLIRIDAHCDYALYHLPPVEPWTNEED